MHLVAPSTVSLRSQAQPSVRLTSRILNIAKTYNVQDVREGFGGNLSSTLEKLYAWEKKLYKEVKVSICVLISDVLMLFGSEYLVTYVVLC